jgi:hypothetical protein
MIAAPTHRHITAPIPRITLLVVLDDDVAMVFLAFAKVV